MIDFVVESLQKGGLVLLPIFIASVWAWWLIVLVFFRLQGAAMGKSRIKKWIANPALIKNWVESQKKPSRTLAGELVQKMSRLTSTQSKDDYDNAIDEVLKWRIPQLDKNIDLIGVLAGMAPLLGLLGTVSGMITTFRVIGAYGTSNPALMADSISEALMTTQNGLVVAFPLMIVHILLFNYRTRVEDDAMELSAHYTNFCLNQRKEI